MRPVWERELLIGLRPEHIECAREPGGRDRGPGGDVFTEYDGRDKLCSHHESRTRSRRARSRANRHGSLPQTRRDGRRALWRRLTGIGRVMFIATTGKNMDCRCERRRIVSHVMRNFERPRASSSHDRPFVARRHIPCRVLSRFDILKKRWHAMGDGRHRRIDATQ